MIIFVQLCSISQGQAGGSIELNLTKEKFYRSVKSKSMDSAVRLFGFESWFCHFAAMWS